jgi:acetyltransferase-like isoleucine patch superfamily enzyme
MPWISGTAEIFIGDNLEIYDKINIFSGISYSSPQLLIGDNVSIGGGVTFLIAKSISIGNRVLIGNNCSFYDNDAHPINVQRRKQREPIEEESIKSIIIEDDAWIGFNSIILKGVTIGKGSIVSAGSVVRKSVPPFTIVAGNPARPTLKIKNNT